MTIQSQDLNSDAVRITQSALGEFTEEQHQHTSHRLSAAGLVAGLLGAGLAIGAGNASAAGAPTDTQALQTAASIENLAVSVYQTATGLPFIKNGNPTVAAFITKTTLQHQAHAHAFNAAITSTGGKTQTSPDPKYAASGNGGAASSSACSRSPRSSPRARAPRRRRTKSPASYV